MKASSIDYPVVSQGGHSARVDMSLLVNGFSLTVAQMGSDFILINNPVDHAPTEATLTMTVDSVERRWKIRLPHGVSAASRRVAITPAN